jgi:hypothetical protein
VRYSRALFTALVLAEIGYPLVDGPTRARLTVATGFPWPGGYGPCHRRAVVPRRAGPPRIDRGIRRPGRDLVPASPPGQARLERPAGRAEQSTVGIRVVPVDRYSSAGHPTCPGYVPVAMP